MNLIPIPNNYRIYQSFLICFFFFLAMLPQGLFLLDIYIIPLHPDANLYSHMAIVEALNNGDQNYGYSYAYLRNLDLGIAPISSMSHGHLYQFFIKILSYGKVDVKSLYNSIWVIGILNSILIFFTIFLFSISLKIGYFKSLYFSLTGCLIGQLIDFSIRGRPEQAIPFFACLYSIFHLYFKNINCSLFLIVLGFFIGVVASISPLSGAFFGICISIIIIYLSKNLLHEYLSLLAIVLISFVFYFIIHLIICPNSFFKDVVNILNCVSLGHPRGFSVIWYVWFVSPLMPMIGALFLITLGLFLYFNFFTIFRKKWALLIPLSCCSFIIFKNCLYWAPLNYAIICFFIFIALMALVNISYQKNIFIDYFFLMLFVVPCLGFTYWTALAGQFCGTFNRNFDKVGCLLDSLNSNERVAIYSYSKYALFIFDNSNFKIISYHFNDKQFGRFEAEKKLGIHFKYLILPHDKWSGPTPPSFHDGYRLIDSDQKYFNINTAIGYDIAIYRRIESN